MSIALHAKLGYDAELRRRFIEAAICILTVGFEDWSITDSESPHGGRIIEGQLIENGVVTTLTWEILSQFLNEPWITLKAMVINTSEETVRFVAHPDGVFEFGTADYRLTADKLVEQIESLASQLAI